MQRSDALSLLINIDHIATVRNARGGRLPDPLEAARTCIEAGADGIVCHLREDRRHIRDADVRLIGKRLKSRFDLEMAATPEIITIALRTKPDLVTLVPEHRLELTTEGGLDVIRGRTLLGSAIAKFHRRGIPVSLFIDPVLPQIRAAKQIGADVIELHTGEYADATSVSSRRRQLGRLRTAAALGDSIGLQIHAGHGLDYKNTAPVARIPALRELSIGYAIIAHALDVGLFRAVKEMVTLIRQARQT